MDSNNSRSLIDTAVRVALIGTLSILSLFLYAQTRLAIENFGRVNATQVASITVNGTGKATAVPNVANISFTVEEKATTGEEAQNKATALTNEALTLLKKKGVANKDIQTSGYQVAPQYEVKPCAPGTACSPGTGKISNYVVSHSIEVKLRDTAKAGEVIQALTAAGVQNISGPNFVVDDTGTVTAQARQNAIEDATQKAQVLASQLNVHLGRVVGFSENGGNAYPMMDRGVAKATVMSARAPAPSLPVGESETTSNVSVSYEIR